MANSVKATYSKGAIVLGAARHRRPTPMLFLAQDIRGDDGGIGGGGEPGVKAM